MTRDEAAEALDALVAARGPDWVANRIARVRLAGWLEGSEDLPDWMVTVMQVLTSGQREKTGDVGCFEDADDHPPEGLWLSGCDHPPEVPEDVTETGWRAVPMPTVGRGEALWDVYRSGLANLSTKELDEMEEAAWAEAGKRHGVDALKEHGFLPDIMPITAWDIGCSWASIVDALADVVRSAIEEDDR
jgi:hypothetical protein